MIYLIVTLVFVVALAVFSGMETGLISIRKPRLEHGVKSGLKTAKILDFFLSRPGLMLSTMLIGINLCVAAASVMGKQCAEHYGFTGNLSLLIVTCVMTTILLAAEIIPKNWFRQSPYDRCLLFAWPVYAAYFVLWIPVRLFSLLTAAMTRLFSKTSGGGGDSKALIREDFRTFLRESEAEGVLESDAADILDKSVDFYTLKVGDIKIDMKNVKHITGYFSVADAVEFCKIKAVSRVAVYKNPTDRQWSGVFCVYDAFYDVPEEKWASTKVTACMRGITTIGADASISALLAESKKSSNPFLVVTESGKSPKQVGIVTPMDVVRAIFGD
jgi:CBS domain containing-hemolysin-like protein